MTGIIERWDCQAKSVIGASIRRAAAETGLEDDI